MCERLYNSQDSVERAHAESTLKCFSSNADYISQCQYLLDNASSPYALMLASSSLLKQVTEQSLPLHLRIDIRNILACLQLILTRSILGAIYIWLGSLGKNVLFILLSTYFMDHPREIFSYLLFNFFFWKNIHKFGLCCCHFFKVMVASFAIFFFPILIKLQFF